MYDHDTNQYNLLFPDEQIEREQEMEQLKICKDGGDEEDDEETGVLKYRNKKRQRAFVGAASSQYMMRVKKSMGQAPC